MEEGQQIILTVMIGTSMMLGLAAVIILFVTQHRRKYLQQQNMMQKLESEKKQEILRAMISTQEEERSRIARNLHDSIGASLSMFQLNLTKYIYFLKDTNFNTDALIEDVKHLDITIDRIRETCMDLYPMALERYGIVSMLQELAQRVNDTGHIRCTFDATVGETNLQADLAKKVNCLRIYQEVLNNILKYANCATLNITLHAVDKQLQIRFSHNGRPFLNDDARRLIANHKGLGLASINNRLELLDGSIDYFHDGQLTETLIIVPLLHG